MAEIDEINKELESRLLATQEKWNKIVFALKDRLSDDVKEIVELEAEVISQIQILNDEITTWSVKMGKNISKVKKKEKELFEFYCVGYKIKTNATEKARLIESDMAQHQFLINLNEIHLEFLRETKNNVDNMRWAIKNKIALLTQLGIQ